MIETIKDYQSKYPYNERNMLIWIGNYSSTIYVDTDSRNRYFFYITKEDSNSVFENINPNQGFKTISAIKKYLIKHLRQTRRDIDKNIKQFLLEENNDNNNNKQRNK